MLSGRSSCLEISPEAERRYLESVQLGDAPPTGRNKPLEQNKRYGLFVKPGMLRNQTRRTQTPTPEKPASPSLEENSQPPEVRTLESVPADLQLGAGLEGSEAPAASVPMLSDPEPSEDGQPPGTPPPSPPPLESNLSWGLGVMEKLALVVMAGVIGFASLLIVGGYLELFDASVFQQLTRGYVHQFEFEESLSSRRVRNSFSRTPLLVVEGRVRNLFLTSSHVGHVRLKAIALDQQGQVLDESVFFAGVVFSDEELENMGLAEIRELQQMAIGRDAPNLNLRNEQEVPFQAVFFRASEAVGDVRVKLVSYERGRKSVFVRFPDSR